MAPFLLFSFCASVQICYAECQTELPGFKFFGTQFGKQVRSILPATEPF